MKMKYYINGFRENENYFYRLVNGRFDKKQKEQLKNSEIVTDANDNKFWIEED